MYGVIDFDRNIDLVSESFHATIIEKRIRIIRHINLARTFSSFAPVVRLIFQNLIENSIHFTRTDPEINIRVSENTGVLIIEIADNGEGILAEFQNRIFEMYFRANEKSKGNGLGLYIVKKAVEKLGGTISFVSRLDEGSTFTVTLPFEHKV